MTSRRGDLEGATRRVLAADLGQVLTRRIGRLFVVRRRCRRHDRAVRGVLEKRDRVGQRSRPPYLNPGNQLGLRDIGRGHQDPEATRGARGQCDRQDTPDGPNRAVERKLARQDDVSRGGGA